MSDERLSPEIELSPAPDYKTIWCELIDSTTGHYVSGWGAIIKGADVPPETLAAALRDYHSRDTFRVVSGVQHLHYMPRVKWCSRHDGFGCDSEGDWHGHWFGVKHNPAATDCCYTLALPVFERVIRPAVTSWHCRECGHCHTPDGCIGDPTPSDLWAGVTPSACDCDAVYRPAGGESDG